MNPIPIPTQQLHRRRQDRALRRRRRERGRRIRRQQTEIRQLCRRHGWHYYEDHE